MIKVLLFLLLVFTLYFCNGIIINTRLGYINGSERKSRDGRIYYVFTGIPYAKPPVGQLRFKNPVKPEPWIDILDGTKEPPTCLQIGTLCLNAPIRNNTIGQEDCLYLNVYTPEVSPEEKLPVMVQIHGGGFRCGNYGVKDSPDYLMDKDIIMVNFNYRLSALGFLSTEDVLISGNFGLKDQSMALSWVKDNIDSFGGDADRITLFGQGAGGASAHYHMLSPLSKDLIAGVISQSGVINDVWSFSRPGTAKRLTAKVAETVGCNHSNGLDLLDCLQKVSAEKIIKTELDFLFWDFEPFVVFKPIKETDEEGAFLTFDPFTMETRIPWITGIVDREGIFKLTSLISQNTTISKQLIDNIDEYLPRLLNADISKAEVRATIRLIKNRYFPDLTDIKSVEHGVELFFTDVNYIYPMARAIRRHKGPLYQYLYDYRAAGSMIDIFGDYNLGVNHGDDLLTLLNWDELFPKEKKLDQEQVSRTMVRMWSNFAKYHKPTTKEDAIMWPEYGPARIYMHITNKLKVEKQLRQHVIDWWDKLPMFRKIPEKTEL